MFKYDVAEAWQIGFQDAATIVMEEIVYLHNHIMQFATMIMILVVTLLYYALTRNKSGISHRYMIHGTGLEIAWTILPAFILLAIAVPSFKLLYLQDEIGDALITIKTIGRQWYWTVEYSDYASNEDETLSFDMYMVSTTDLNLGDNRLLEVDNRIVLPIDVNTRIITTASDVIHSLAVPSLGLKTDAVPGRLNETGVLIYRPGTYYGQCSEICGFGHGFMPIVVEAVSLDDYILWVKTSMSA